MPDKDSGKCRAYFVMGIEYCVMRITSDPRQKRKQALTPLLQTKFVILGDKLRVNSKASKHTLPCCESCEQLSGTSSG